MTVLEELDMLVKETKELLDGPDPDPEAWQAYGEKREAVFASFSKGFEVREGENAPVCRLIEELLEQSRVVEDRVGRSLARFRGEISDIAKKRRALRGYARSRSGLLFQSCA